MDRVPFFHILLKHLLVSYCKMPTFFFLWHPATILVTALIIPENLTNDLIILKLITYFLCVRYLLRIQQYPVNTTYNILGQNIFSHKWRKLTFFLKFFSSNLSLSQNVTWLQKFVKHFLFRADLKDNPNSRILLCCFLINLGYYISLGWAQQHGIIQVIIIVYGSERVVS